MAKCYLYDIVNPRPSTIHDDHWHQLYSRMRESDWYQPKGQRKGFVNLIRRRDVIGGFFAHEGTKRAFQYDDNKEQLEPPPFYSFEHLFFALFQDTSQLLLQSRNIYDYVDLRLPLMRSSLLHLLTELLRWVGVYVLGDCLDIESAGTLARPSLAVTTRGEKYSSDQGSVAFSGRGVQHCGCDHNPNAPLGSGPRRRAFGT